MDPSSMPQPKPNYTESLERVDDDEKLLAVIRRHPFGIVKLYFQVFIGLALVIGLVMYLLPGIVNRDDNPGVYSIVGGITVVFVALMLVIVGIATIIYNKSQLVITNKTITQTIQVGLFRKKTSQLAVSSVEDVTANTNGFFPTLFKYGRLLIETAGEQENFHFDYAPHADHYAKLVLETREQFMGHRETEMMRAGQSYAQMNQDTTTVRDRASADIAQVLLDDAKSGGQQPPSQPV